MSLDRAQRRYDNASPPEDRPACEGICGGEADEHFTQHASEDDRDYCADCREGAAACARYDLDEVEPDDLTNHRAMLLRHLGGGARCFYCRCRGWRVPRGTHRPVHTGCRRGHGQDAARWH